MAGGAALFEFVLVERCRRGHQHQSQWEHRGRALGDLEHALIHQARFQVPNTQANFAAQIGQPFKPLDIEGQLQLIRYKPRCVGMLPLQEPLVE